MSSSWVSRRRTKPPTAGLDVGSSRFVELPGVGHNDVFALNGETVVAEVMSLAKARR